MLSIVNSCNLIGIDGFIVNVEVDITRGMPCFNIVGLASIEIKEAKERVKSAIINSDFEFPTKRIVVNLSPADIKKRVFIRFTYIYWTSYKLYKKRKIIF